jgi:hypothetical protein
MVFPLFNRIYRSAGPALSIGHHPWVQGSDEDIVACIAHALRHEGKKAICQADQWIAQAVTARIMEALKRSYIINPKAPHPLASADQLPEMCGGN